MFKIFLFLSLVFGGFGSLVVVQKGPLTIRKILGSTFMFCMAIGLLLLGLSKILWGIGFMMVGLISLLGIRFAPKNERGI